MKGNRMRQDHIVTFADTPFIRSFVHSGVSGHPYFENLDKTVIDAVVDTLVDAKLYDKTDGRIIVMVQHVDQAVDHLKAQLDTL